MEYLKGKKMGKINQRKLEHYLGYIIYIMRHAI